MYQHPLVYGDSTIEPIEISSMYPMRSYYEDKNIAMLPGIDNEVALQKPSSALSASHLKMEQPTNSSSILTEDNLETILSNQMLLLSCLTELEAKVSAFDPLKKTTISLPSLSLPSLSLSLTPSDHVIHFNLKSPPYLLFTLVRLLMKAYPDKVLVNCHAHSSLSQLSHRYFSSLKLSLRWNYGLEFTPNHGYLSREERPLKFTFIATENSNKNLQQSQEILLVKKLATDFFLVTHGLENFWNLFTDPNYQNNPTKINELLGSTRLLEQLSNLSSTNFLNGNTPILEDFILNSLSFSPGFSSVFEKLQLNNDWKSTVGALLKIS